jgi:hypothetical protein
MGEGGLVLLLLLMLMLMMGGVGVRCGFHCGFLHCGGGEVAFAIHGI